MLPLRKVFGSVAAEAGRKVDSMTSSPDESESALATTVTRHLAEDGQRAVKRAVQYTKKLPSDGGSYPKSILLYLSHPLRVARLALELHPSPSPLLGVIGVLHNVYEVCALDELALISAGFPREVASAIRLLTIDRRHETAPVYLTEFYRAIEQHSDDLALLRCVDKLDNLLGLELIEDGRIRVSYIDLAERFVAPIAERLASEFGRFFREVVAHMRVTGCRPDLKARYDRFISGQPNQAGTS